MFWTILAIYNPITKGVMDLRILKRTFLLTTAIAGCIISFIFLISNNSPKAAEACLELPYRIEDTGVVLNCITGYDGPFLEDRSSDTVTNIAVAMLYNSSGSFLDSVVIDLSTDLNSYHFEATMIPPGACVAVQDLNRCQWDGRKILNCTGKAKYCTTDAAIPWNVEIIAQNNASILVVNNSDEPVSITVYHKTWQQDRQAYIGGITYKTAIRNLQPHDRLVCKPEFFTENSKIIRIE